MENDIIATIRWSITDLKEALVGRGFEPTDENIEELLLNRFEKTLIEGSIAEGWRIIDDLISMASLIKSEEVE